LEGSGKIAARGLANMRLHVRAIVRDRNRVFIGSQSLRAAELETRREVGIIFRDAKIAGRMIKTFEDDWTLASEQSAGQSLPAAKTAKKVAKVVAKSLPPVAPVVELLVKETANGEVELDSGRLEEAVRVAVKQAVEQSVLSVVEQAEEESTGQNAVPAGVES
jgi:hypothetical protein